MVTEIPIKNSLNKYVLDCGMHSLISEQDLGTADLQPSTDIITLFSEVRGTNSKHLYLH